MLLSKGVQELCFQSKLELISLEKHFAFFFFFLPKGTEYSLVKLFLFIQGYFQLKIMNVLFGKTKYYISNKIDFSHKIKLHFYAIFYN